MDAFSLPSTGERIAWYRQRLGMSQRDLATAIERTSGWVSTVERGNADVERVSTLRAIANALQVTAVDLCPELGDPPTSDPEPEAERLAEMLAIIPGLVAFLGADPTHQPPPSLSESRQRVQRCQRLLRARDYHTLIPDILELIPKIGAAEHARPNSQWTILRTDLYGLAARVLVALGHPAAAWVAMDRGIFLTTAPREYSDYWLSMLLRLAELHALLRRTDWAIGTGRNVVSAGRHLVDHLDNSSQGRIPHLVITGAAYLRLATWQSTTGAFDQADTDLQTAGDIVGQLAPGEHTAFGFNLGPSSLALASITVAVAKQDYQGALSMATQLEPTTLSTDDQRAALAIQLALAHVGRNEFDPALEQLVLAEQIDPYEVATTAAAAQAIGELAALRPRNTRLPDALRDLLTHLRTHRA